MIKLKNLLSFREDLFFEGAVQADWFYSKERSDKVTESFVFHGPKYFKNDSVINSKVLIDTASLTLKIYDNLYNVEKVNPFMLGIAGYGTGKSHLSVALAKLFTNSEKDSIVTNKLLSNLKLADSKIANSIDMTNKKNLVLVLNGMKDFNLNYEILKTLKHSLELNNINSDFLESLSQTYVIAKNFVEKNFNKNTDEYIEAFSKKNIFHENLKEYIIKNIETDEIIFNIINEIYRENTGHEIKWDEGISAGKILEVAEEYLIHKKGLFDKILIIFDEFGRFLEYASGNPQKAGDSALQQIFETIQNKEGNILFLGFIQSDIKTYLSRVDKTSNISRYIGRYDVSEKFYLSSNLETIFANLIEKKDMKVFKHYIEDNINGNEKYFKNFHEKLIKWLPTIESKDIWNDYNNFKKIIVEGVYPFNPISTYMLSSMSEWLQNRSSLTMLNKKIKSFADMEIKEIGLFKSIYPVDLLEGDLFEEIFNAETEGRQRSSFSIQYSNILSKLRDKISESDMKVLSALLLMKILKVKNNSKIDTMAVIEFFTGMQLNQITECINLLEVEYGVIQYDERAFVFDFIVDSVGVGEFKRFIQKQKNEIEFSYDVFNDISIQEKYDISSPLKTSFTDERKIVSNEWDFEQHLFIADRVDESNFRNLSQKIMRSTSGTMQRAALVWLYLNKDTDFKEIEIIQKRYINHFIGLPIEVMVLNDSDNSLKDSLEMYLTLKSIKKNSEYVKRYEKFIPSLEEKTLEEIEEGFRILKISREKLTSTGIERINSRLIGYLGDKLEQLYPNILPFPFDGFANKALANFKKFFVEMSKMLLSGKNYADITTRDIQLKNRFEAVLINSWGVIEKNYSIKYPNNELLKNYFNFLDKKLNDKKLKISEIYEIFTNKPYGLNDYSFTLMIITYLANRSDEIVMTTGGRFKEKLSLSKWRERIFSTGTKTDIVMKELLEAEINIVDIEDIGKKFEVLCQTILNNSDLSRVENFKNELDNFINISRIPDDKLMLLQFAQERLNQGKTLAETYLGDIKEIQLDIDDAIRKDDVGKLLRILNKIEKFEPSELYNYIYPKRDIKTQKERALIAIKEKSLLWISKVYCSEPGKLDNFERNNKVYAKQLFKLGFSQAASKLEDKIDHFVRDIQLVREINAIESSINKFLRENIFSTNTNYQDLKVANKKIKELTENLEKNYAIPQNLKQEYRNKLEIKHQEIKKYISEIEKKIQEIYDITEELDTVEKAEKIIVLIPALLGRGLDVDQGQELREVQNFITLILEKINLLKKLKKLDGVEELRDEIEEISFHEDLSIDMTEVLNKEYESLKNTLLEKEEKWIQENLEINLEKIENSELQKHLRKIKDYPEFISKKTESKIEKLEEKINKMLSKNKLEFLMLKFNELTSEEKDKFKSMI